MLQCKTVFYLSSDITSNIFLGCYYFCTYNFVHHTVEQSYTRLVVVHCTNLERTSYMHTKETQIAKFNFLQCLTNY